jgi:DNA-binding GntR family transcriptional regulator
VKTENRVDRCDTANSRCYNQLRRMLINGQIPPGVRLTEVAWAERMDTHRALMHEVMSLLVHEGLLQRRSRGGFVTPLFEQRDLDEIWEARAVLEVGALRLIAARQFDEAALRPLVILCDTQRQMLDMGMELGFIEADRKFHETLVELAGNGRLLTMYRRASLPHTMPRANAPEELLASRLATIQEHRDIHRLILERQLVEARTLLEKHLHMSPRL